MVRLFLILILIAFTPLSTLSQDTLSVGFNTVLGTKNSPFWIYANKNGIIDKNSPQIIANINYTSKHQLFPFLTADIGFDFIGRYSNSSTLFFNQGYIHLFTEHLKLSAGRFKNSSPTHNFEIGMGSLGVSGNATPIPQIRAGTNGWITVPLTWKLLDIKGHISHGWMERKNYIDNVFFHEKVGHLRVGGNLPVNLYGGLAHYALWGGQNHPKFGDLPSSFNDFWRVFIAQGGDENAPPGDQNYILGDHKGAWDFGFSLDFKTFNVLAYRQFPIETKEELKFKAIEDGLNGIEFTFKNELQIGLKSLVYEFLNTKYQRGPFRPDPDNERYPFKGNANYYNNGVYRSGWIYNDYTIGNPLFVPRDYGVGVGNNRIVAHHLGMFFNINDNLAFKLKLTYSNNHGNWGSRVLNRPDMGKAFIPPKKQFSVLYSFHKKLTINDLLLHINFEAGYDNGELIGNNIGIHSGFKLHL